MDRGALILLLSVCCCLTVCSLSPMLYGVLLALNIVPNPFRAIIMGFAQHDPVTHLKQTVATNVDSSITGGATGRTNITFYGATSGDDNGQGFSGVNLAKYGKTPVRYDGRPVYPAAVHQDHAAHFLYKILEVEGKGVNKLLVHIVDVCDRSDSSCQMNVKKNGLNFLIDIHQTGFKAAGLSDGITVGTYRVVGELRPAKMPLSAWLKGGKDYIMCSCTGKCEGKEQKWTPLSKCR